MKHVEVRCYGPIAVDKIYESGWEDIWLRLHNRRETLYLAPTLISLPDLEGELKRNLERKKPDAEDIEFFNKMIGEVKANGFACSHEIGEKNWKLSNLYTVKNGIDRAEANRMMTWWLERIGFKNIKFHWKYPSIVITPVSLR